ncbi:MULTISPECIES: PAS domain-containing hybrid sensor histidine kinase/response regulator [Phenylobacterium]|jgi:PAS domain S-box-containing protein|uniref:histidine kinase n=1 Tax=Phenylobacterium conjunctum TaxID=1298959 RepID=A0ABW3T0B1_9CAUL
MPHRARLLEAVLDRPSSAAWPAGASLALALDEAAIVAITDVAGTITYCNDKFCELSGYARDELIGANHRLLKSSAHPPEMFRDLYRTIAQGGVWRGTLCNRRKDGDLYWVNTTIVPQLGPQGRPQSYIAIRFDVTEHIALQAELARAKLEADRAATDKGRFFANMSHELRTPLAGVTGLVHLLTGTRLDPVQSGYVNTLRETAELLRVLVDDVLLLSQAEANAITLHRQPTCVANLARRVGDMVAPTAAAKGVRLAVICAEDLPEHLQLDPSRLSQVLANLLGNAVKFTDAGDVTLRVDWRAGTLCCEVTDSGPGFNPEQKARLFRAFEQDTGSGHYAEGTGLGLAIAAGIIHAMQGWIDAENRAEGGARFWFEIVAPLSAALAPEQTQPEPADLVQTCRRVLVVEDNETLRFLAQHILEDAGHAVTLAVDGEDGVRQLRSQPFDLCLMDLRMPRMGGPEAVALIRADPDPRVSGTPVVALSADILDYQDETLAALGFDGFLAKPIQVAELLALVSLIGQAAEAA